MASFITQTSAKNEPHKHQNSILSDSRDLIRRCRMTLKHLKWRCTPHYIVMTVSDKIQQRSVNGCTNCCIFWSIWVIFLGENCNCHSWMRVARLFWAAVIRIHHISRDYGSCRCQSCHFQLIADGTVFPCRWCVIWEV